MPVMTHLQVAALYVALSAIITLVLAINTAFTRGRTKVLLGDGGNEEMLRAMRAHANNVEYVPLALTMLVLMALLQCSVYVLHGVGIALVVGRIVHGIGLTMKSGLSFGRGLGAFLTIAAMVVEIVALFMAVAR